ncbi:MAG: CvpA family protein [Ruminococcus sp.]|nr:CvpA family protein [Ruminococcus sp.]
MKEELWWLYDIIALSALIVGCWISGRKGIFRSAIVLIGGIIGITFAFPVSESIGKNLYKTLIRDNNVKTLDKSLGDVEISEYLGKALENMGYNVIVSDKKLNEILDSDGDIDTQIYKYLNNINGKKVDNENNFRDKLYGAYAETLSDIFSGDISLYAMKTAENKILTGKTDTGNLIKMMRDGNNRKDVAEIIADNYISNAYIKIIRLIAFVILYAFILIIGILTANSLSGGMRDVDVGTGSRIGGGVCGFFTAVTVIFILSVILKLYVVMGSNQELFFDNNAIDKTYIFGYAYNIADKL